MAGEITNVIPHSDEVGREVQVLDVLVLMKLIDLTTVIEAAVQGCILGARTQQSLRRLTGKPVTITPETSSRVVCDLVLIPDFQSLLAQLESCPALAELFRFENGKVLSLQQIRARMIWLRGAIRQTIDGQRFFQPDGSYRVE